MRARNDDDRPDDRSDDRFHSDSYGDSAVRVINQRWIKAVIAYQGRVLLVRQNTADAAVSAEGRWVLPGAQMRPHETVPQALTRIVAAQTGLVTSGGVQMHSGRWSTVDGRAIHLITATFHLCPIVVDPAGAIESWGAPVVVPGAEHDMYGWASLLDMAAFDVVEPDRSAAVTFFMDFCDHGGWDESDGREAHSQDDRDAPPVEPYRCPEGTYHSWWSRPGSRSATEKCLRGCGTRWGDLQTEPDAVPLVDQAG